jgi:hypothetical protein
MTTNHGMSARENRQTTSNVDTLRAVTPLHPITPLRDSVQDRCEGELVNVFTREKSAQLALHENMLRRRRTQHAS